MKPVEMRLRVPKSIRGAKKIPADLVASFARPGYAVSLTKDSDPPMLLVRRAGKLRLKGDHGALAPHLDHPFEAQELKSLEAIAATYKPKK